MALLARWRARQVRRPGHRIGGRRNELLLKTPRVHHPLHSVMVLTRLEVVLLGQVITVMGSGTSCLGFTALLLVPKVLLLDLLL